MQLRERAGISRRTCPPHPNCQHGLTDMITSRTSHEHLKKIFTENFSVGDIAEPLVSFDAVRPGPRVREFMGQRAFEVVGVRRNGVIVGYVRRDELGDGDCIDCLREFDPEEVVSDSACFAAVVRLLSERPRIFVTGFGEVGGIVTRSDLQKAPVRMWLFGMVSIIEMNLMRLIEAKYDGDDWRQHVSEARLQKAEELLAERKRRNQELSLIDCLQFSDKGQIVLKDEQLRERVGFTSRRRGEDTIKGLQALRNNLAHSQDIISFDWDTIVRLAENLDTVLESVGSRP